MPGNENFHKKILDRVRKTFGILREIFSETPPEPIKQPQFLLRAGLNDRLANVDGSSLGNKPVPARKASSAGKNAKEKIAQKTPARESISLSDVHKRYLENLITAYEFVSLPGFHAEGQLLKIPLEKLFVPLSLNDKRLGFIRPERDDSFYGGAAGLSLSSALQRYRRLVIIGGPGSGKTYLLLNILLAYSRSLYEQREGSFSQAGRDEKKLSSSSKQRLAAEDGHLPILLSLRELGQYLKKSHHRPGFDSKLRLLNYLRESCMAQELSFQENFFHAYLASGKAVILMDGLDEVDDSRLRERVARLIEKFVKGYPDCRYVVTSRPWGCEGAALLGEQFGTLQIGDFNSSEARKFIRSFSITVETGLMGVETPEVLGQAKQRAEKLVNDLDSSPRMAELAVSPLALTVLALVQRERDQLPESRLDLFESGLQVLMASGLFAQKAIRSSRDVAEGRRTLEMIAFWLHQNNQSEIGSAELTTILQSWFLQWHKGDEARAAVAVSNFLQFVDKEGGLFFQYRPGKFGFAQRTFQELLAAQALAEREDTLAYTLKCLASPWWHEVILFEAGILNRQAKHRLRELVQFILGSGSQTGQQPYHSAFLASECLFDLNLKHLETGLSDDVKKSLRKLVNSQIQPGDRQGLVNKVTASNALVSLQAGAIQARFWTPPFGEPEWVRIPAGEFWMGETDGDSNFAHVVALPEYQIARVPVTNAQYALYLKDSAAELPDHWRSGKVPKGRENHPVVNVNWHEALAYCTWLAEKTNQPVCLPSEAEWEKAARGTQDQREYPWGAWDELRANTSEFALGDTTPVGLFPTGASPFGLLDMTGNVREWTRSLADFNYPYDPMDKTREDLHALDDQPRVLRGGSYYYTHDFARCAQRQYYYPDFRFFNFGFRVVISPVFS